MKKNEFKPTGYMGITNIFGALIEIDSKGARCSRPVNWFPI